MKIKTPIKQKQCVQLARLKKRATQQRAARFARKSLATEQGKQMLDTVRELLQAPCDTGYELRVAMKSLAQTHVLADHVLVLTAYALGHHANEAEANEVEGQEELANTLPKLIRRSRSQFNFYKRFARAWDRAGRSVDDLSEYSSLSAAARSVGVATHRKPDAAAKGPAVRKKMLATVTRCISIATTSKGKKAKKNWCRALRKIIENATEALRQLQEVKPFQQHSGAEHRVGVLMSHKGY